VADQTRRLLGGWLRQWYPNARLHRWQPLGTGVTARVFGVDYSLRGRRERVVMRLLDVPLELGWRESLLLHTLANSGVPAPTCHGVKHRGHTCCMLLDWLPGKVVARPRDKFDYARQAAQALAQIHDVEVRASRLPRFSTGFSGRVAQMRNRYPEHTVICDALSRNPPASAGLTHVLLHGDFWPGNLLFERKQLTGIVDWSDACIGDRLVDVANARLELRWLWGEDAMRDFTSCYLNGTGLRADALPFWDLAALLKPVLGMHRWGLTPPQTRRLRSAIADHATAALAGKP
jgi:aminoglycoside phosphotransferase (APT) family kinase protein